MADIRLYIKEIEQLKTRLQQQRERGEKVKRYMQHLPQCDLWVKVDIKNPPCSCGYEAALKELEPK